MISKLWIVIFILFNAHGHTQILPTKLRIHPESDIFPANKIELLYDMEKNTTAFCRARRDKDLKYFTVRYYADSNYWQVTYRCEE